MALKMFAILVLLAVGTNAQKSLPDLLGSSLQQKFTELDCLLGKPNCPSPPPPVVSPPPPSPEPTTPPPVVSPPPPSPEPTPAASPPTVPPTPAPVPAPVPAPAQAPAPSPTTAPPTPVADGIATLILALETVGPVLTSAQKMILSDLIAQQTGSQVAASERRRLLAADMLVTTLSGIKSCQDALTQIQEYLFSGDFKTDAAAKGINLSGATLDSYACMGAGKVTFEVPAPAPAPGPAAGRKML